MTLSKSFKEGDEGDGIRSWAGLGFGEETLVPLSTLTSLGDENPGRACRSGTPEQRQIFGLERQRDCGEAQSGGDIPDQGQRFPRAEQGWEGKQR